MKKYLKFFFTLLRYILASPGKLPVGGQAVIEGVLMKGPVKWGLAVRKPEGDIFTETWPLKKWTSARPWNLPVVRGLAVMADMLSTGIRALNRSAQISLGDDESITFWEMSLSIAVAIVAVVGLFILLPVWVADLFQGLIDLSFAGKNVLEGVARASVFIMYLYVISLWKDIRRVFQYHGAEHKTINAYENDSSLDPGSVSKYSRIHTRCGTSFLLIVIAVSIIVFSLAGPGSIMYRVVLRVVLLPVVIGISYEIIKAASSAGKMGECILMPALSLQYLTTREPDLFQIEVAVVSLKTALQEQKRAGAE